MIGQQATLHVLRARVHGARADPFQTRLSVERMLADVDPAPMIGQAAILVARRARLDLTTRHRAMQPLVAAMLAGLVSRSCRPIHGFVPADAEAVLFADDVELLVCLARASLSGALGGQWWWESLLAVRYGTDGVLAAWLRRTTAIAPALDALDREGQAAAFIASVGEGRAGRLQQALVDVHDLHWLADDPEHWASGAQPSAQIEGQEQHHPLPPWKALGLDARTLALPPSLQTVIGLAVGLCRAPVLTRRLEFQRALLAWQARGSVTTNAPAIRPGGAGPDATAAVSAPVTPGDNAEADSADAAACHGAEPATDRLATTRDRAVLPGEARIREAAMRISATPVARMEEAAERPALHLEVVPAPDAPRHTAAASAAGSKVVETRFGGIIFLLNVALALELWGDFTAPHHRNEAIVPLGTPWEWLAAMGERLCGGTLHADPLWDLLRHLSGSELTDFPSRGRHGEEWRIPPPWLVPFGPLQGLRVFVSAGRLRIEHPAGFPLLDRHADRRGVGLDAMARYLRARLCLALHVPRFREAGAILLRQDARLVLTATRLDATFALSRHPVAVRVAGLDRDPGWIAAAGRDIRLHFQ